VKEKNAETPEPVRYRFTDHKTANGAWCRWSLVDVVAPELRVTPGNTKCPWECPDSDVEEYTPDDDD
jgi:hypothetical protein